MVWPSLVALCFAAHNATVPGPQRSHHVWMPVLLACLVLQLPAAWGGWLMGLPLVSAAMGCLLELVMTRSEPCSAAAWPWTP